MTTNLVVTITDEFLQEIADYYGGADCDEAMELLSGDGCVKVASMALELIAMRTERAELKRDAERYRWLRNDSVDADGDTVMAAKIDGEGNTISNWMFGRLLDDSIDQAMQERQK